MNRIFAQVVQALAINEALSVGFPEIASGIAHEPIENIVEFVGESIPGWNVTADWQVEWPDRNVRIYTAPTAEAPIVVEVHRDDEWVQVAMLDLRIPIGVIVEIVEAILVGEAR